MTNYSNLSSGEVSEGLEARNKQSTTLRVLETEKSTTYYLFHGPRKTGPSTLLNFCLPQ